MQVGYALSSEEHKPRDLVANAVAAETAGFPFALISDHFHPWIDRQGESPFVWSVLGGIAASTTDLVVGTGVTCPLVRVHPAVIAQAFATMGCLYPGRIILGVGTGEALNEIATGFQGAGEQEWPEFKERFARLRESVRLVIIDSLNGYLNAMPEARHLNLQLHELLAFLNQQGVISILVLAQQGLVGAMQSSVDLTYLADTVLILRYFEAFGAVKQAISVIKKRSGNHERTIREITVGPGGVQVGGPLTHMQGVLTGVPTFHSSEENLLTNLRKK
jgi:G6PDH family F420-dependent oxidoreductase